MVCKWVRRYDQHSVIACEGARSAHTPTGSTPPWSDAPFTIIQSKVVRRMRTPLLPVTSPTGEGLTAIARSPGPCVHRGRTFVDAKAEGGRRSTCPEVDGASSNRHRYLDGRIPCSWSLPPHERVSPRPGRRGVVCVSEGELAGEEGYRSRAGGELDREERC